jgi:hypothetical protein
MVMDVGRGKACIGEKNRVMKKTCLNCIFFDRFAENAGYCNKYKFEVHVNLARKDRVCGGMENKNPLGDEKLESVKS